MDWHRHREFAPRAQRRGFALPRNLLAVAVVVGTLVPIAMFAGSGGFPVAGQVVEKDGQTVPVLVVNPEQGSTPTCESPEGTLKIVTDLFALIRTRPNPSGTALGVVELGELVSVLGQNEDGWWKVLVPGSCDTTGWVQNGAFQTLTFRIEGDGGTAQDATGGDGSTDTQGTPNGGQVGGGIAGTAGITVSQSLKVRMGTVSGADGLVTVRDDGAAFTVAVESQVGSTFTLSLALCNESNNPLIGDLTLTPGLKIKAAKADDVTGIGRAGPSLWKFTMAPSCDDFTPDLILTISIPAGSGPGFNTIAGALKQVAY